MHGHLNDDTLDKMFRDRRKDKDFGLIQNPRLCKDYADMQDGHYHAHDQGEHHHTHVDMNNYGEHSHEKVYMNRQNSHAHSHNHSHGHSHERYYIIFLFNST